MSPEEKKADFGSITSLLKKSAEDSRKGEPVAEPGDELPSSELPESFALPGGEDEAAGGLADQLADEPLEVTPDEEAGRSGGQAVRALKVGGLALIFGLGLAAVLWGLWRPQSLERRYQEGAKLIAAGQDEAAAKIFADCQRLEPHDGRLYHAYALAYERRGEAERALELVMQGLQADSDQRDLLGLQGAYALQRGDLDLAEKAAQLLRNSYHDEMDGYLLQAEVELARRRPLEAISYLYQAERKHAGDVAISRLLRRAWLRAGDIPQAQIANDRLAEQQMAAETEEDYLDLVELQLALDNQYLATEYARAGRVKFPNDDRLLKLEVEVAIRTRHYDRAVEGAQQLVARLPSDPAGYYFLGEAAYARADYGAALAHLQRAEQIDPRYGPALARLGDFALLRLGNVSGALAYYQRAEAVGFATGEFWRNYGMALYRSGRYAEAADRWERAARLMPRSQVIAYNLATAYLRSARTDSAALLYARCSGLEAVQGRLQNNLGVLAELRGDSVAAAREYLAAREAAAERQFALPAAERNMLRFFRGEPLDLRRAEAIDPTVLEEESGR